MAFLRSSDYGKLKQLGGKLFQKVRSYYLTYLQKQALGQVCLAQNIDRLQNWIS